MLQWLRIPGMSTQAKTEFKTLKENKCIDFLKWVIYFLWHSILYLQPTERALVTLRERKIITTFHACVCMHQKRKRKKISQGHGGNSQLLEKVFWDFFGPCRTDGTSLLGNYLTDSDLVNCISKRDWSYTYWSQWKEFTNVDEGWIRSLVSLGKLRGSVSPPKSWTHDSWESNYFKMTLTVLHLPPKG